MVFYICNISNMKRIFLTLFIFLSAITLYAGNDVEFIKGNESFFKDAAGEVFLNVSFENATFDNQMPLTDKFQDIERKRRIAMQGFTTESHEQLKKIRIVPSVTDAIYKITIIVTNVDAQTSLKWSGVKGLWVKIWGKIVVTDIKEDKEVFVAEFEEVKGNSGAFSPIVDRAFNNAFCELVKCLK